MLLSAFTMFMYCRLLPYHFTPTLTFVLLLGCNNSNTKVGGGVRDYTYSIPIRIKPARLSGRKFPGTWGATNAQYTKIHVTISLVVEPNCHTDVEKYVRTRVFKHISTYVHANNLQYKLAQISCVCKICTHARAGLPSQG